MLALLQDWNEAEAISAGFSTATPTPSKGKTFTLQIPQGYEVRARLLLATEGDIASALTLSELPIRDAMKYILTLEAINRTLIK